MTYFIINCAHCGDEFKAERKRKYCTDSCKGQAAYEKALAKAPKCPICNGPHQVTGRNPRPACNTCYKNGRVDGAKVMGKYTGTCEDCGAKVTGKRKYTKCAPCRYEYQKARASAKGHCNADDCDAPQFCKGFCSKHYWRQHYAENPITRRYTGECAHCGKSFTTQTYNTKHCSVGCGVTATVEARERTKAANRVVTCTDLCVYNEMQAQWVSEMQELINEMRRRRGKEKSAAWQKSKRGPMRRAYEDGDMPGLIEAIKASSRITETGCWEWGRQKDNRGYAKVRWGNKGHAVHRLAALAKYGQPESEPVVHHKCANRACCNPDHLQPISQRENMAEMLQRNYYLRRIEELEAALREVAPGHQTLGPLALSA